MLLFKANFCQLYMQKYIAIVLIYIFELLKISDILKFVD